MAYIAMVRVNSSGRVEKFQDYPTQEEAKAHVRRMIGRFPTAYSAPHPGGGSGEWLCDVDAKTIVFDPIPPLPPQSDSEAYDELMSQPDTLSKLIRSLIEKLNTGAFVPGEKLSARQLKSLFKEGLGDS